MPPEVSLLEGSEYPAVAIPLTMGSWMMLQRNRLYTQQGLRRRHTALAHRLRA